MLQRTMNQSASGLVLNSAPLSNVLMGTGTPLSRSRKSSRLRFFSGNPLFRATTSTSTRLVAVRKVTSDCCAPVCLGYRAEIRSAAHRIAIRRSHRVRASFCINSSYFARLRKNEPVDEHAKAHPPEMTHSSDGPFLTDIHMKDVRTTGKLQRASDNSERWASVSDAFTGE